MRNHLGVVSLGVLVVLILVTYMVTFTVETTEVAIVKTFGSAGQPINGADQAGLHFKLPYPFQRLLKFDRRVQMLESPMKTFTTLDQQQIIATLYCAWKIDDAATFQAQVNDMREAEDRLARWLTSAEEILGQYSMAAYVNVEMAGDGNAPGDDPNVAEFGARLQNIDRRLTKYVADKADEFGVAVVMVGIKSLQLPESVTAQVIETQKSERQRAIQDYQAQGRAQAQAIEERAQSARKEILAFAQAKASEIRSEGDRAAAEELRKFSKNEDLAMYLLWLKSLRTQLEKNTEMILDSDSLEPIKFFIQGPSLPDSARGRATDTDGETVATDTRDDN